MTPRHVETRYFAIALVPIVIFAAHAVITDRLFAQDLDVPVTILQEGRDWLEAAGRYRFLAATWFFAALAVLAFALLVRDLLRPMARQTRVASVVTLLIVLSLAVLPSVQNAAAPGGPQPYDRLGGALFEAALSRGSLPGCALAGDRWLLGRCGDMPVVTLLRRVLDIVNVLAGLGVGALIVGMILCLETRATTDAEDAAALLQENLNRMRRQLYLSSLILTFGMFFAASWMYWPLPMVVAAERDAYGAVVLASALFTATYFCLLILSFYLPVALILNGRVRALAERARGGDAATPEDWLAAHGLKESVSDHLRAGFALTAPILAAFAGGISPISL